MLRRVLSYLIAFPVAVILITLAVTNSERVRLVLDPFRPDDPALSVVLPFYVYLFGAALIGILAGGWVMWRSQGHWRREARRRTVEAQRWQGEADRLARERDKLVREQLGQSSGQGTGLRQIASAR